MNLSINNVIHHVCVSIWGDDDDEEHQIEEAKKKQFRIVARACVLFFCMRRVNDFM